jgi:hypothetical protein
MLNIESPSATISEWKTIRTSWRYC